MPNGGGGGRQTFFGKPKGGKHFLACQMGEGGRQTFFGKPKGGKHFLASQKGESIFWQNILEIHHPGPGGVHIIIAPSLNRKHLFQNQEKSSQNWPELVKY